MILRHAKSDWDAAYLSDHDRPLNRRGVRAAKAIGIAVARSGEAPDLAISSSARRALTTVRLAAEAGEWTSDITSTDDLYGTSPQGALDVVAGVASGAQRLMIVGHQPTWGSLVHALTGGSVAIKTATLVAVDFSARTWAEASRARGSISYVLQPRLFTDGRWKLD